MDQIAKKYFQDNHVTFKGGDYHAKPLYDYMNDSRLCDDIVEKLKEFNYVKPTPIQAVSIPMILEGKDFIGISQTGSGKTLGFVLPAFIKLISGQISIDKQEGVCSPLVLILSPTRELALQTKEVIDNFKLFPVACCYGGAPRYDQIKFIKSRRPPFIVGTPGRINDFIDSNIICVSQVKYLVLDEADRMFDMGFYPQISGIIGQSSSNQRQTLLFSATWEGKVEAFASPFLKNDRVFACIGRLDLKANQDIKQRLFLVTEFQKKILLRRILTAYVGFKVIVFANTKAKVNDLCRDYSSPNDFGWSGYIHGDVDQSRRSRIVKEFDSGTITVLFATDVASRGLDINDISVVVNYDIPLDVETYVHRIGRTARYGRKGTAYSFVTNRLFGSPHIHKQLLKVVRESDNEIPDNLKI